MNKTLVKQCLVALLRYGTRREVPPKRITKLQQQAKKALGIDAALKEDR